MNKPKALGNTNFDVDECGLYRPQGFSTVALEYNDNINRLCAIRKRDLSTKSMRLFFLEFYNTMHSPHIVLEWKYMSQKESFDAVVWLGNQVVVGCSDGSLLLMSPFKCDPKRIKICVSPIVAIAVVSASQIAVASESSEVKLLEFDTDNEYTITKVIKFTSEQRIVSLAASLKFSCLAVGLIDEIILVQLPSGQQTNLKVSQNANKSTIVWTLIFVDDFLFSGDSRGKIMIYNPKTGALVKVIHSHQADILAMFYDGEKVYASGTDYRIQILKQISTAQKKSDWSTYGQDIFHENDVRCMTKVGNALVSGGAEHRIIVSEAPNYYYTLVSHPVCSLTEDGRLLLMPYLDHLKLWQRPGSDAEVSQYDHVNIFTEQSGPKLLLNLHHDLGSVILHATMSPNGNYLCSSTNKGLHIYSNKVIDGKAKVRALLCVPNESSSPITALYSTNSSIYFAHGGSTLERINFETLKREIVAVRNANTMLIRIVVNSSETACLVQTARSELLYLDLTKMDVDEEERLYKMKLLHCSSDFKLHTTKNGDPMAVLIKSGHECKIYFVNLKTRSFYKQPIEMNKFTGQRSIISSVSNIVNNSMVLQETHGKNCIVGQLDEVQSFVFSEHKKRSKDAKRFQNITGAGYQKNDEPFEGLGKKRSKKDEEEHEDQTLDDITIDEKGDNDDAENEIMEVDDADLDEFFQNQLTNQNISTNKRKKPEKLNGFMPPFPLEAHLSVDESGTISIVKIRSEPENPPTSIPFNIRRFNRQ